MHNISGSLHHTVKFLIKSVDTKIQLDNKPFSEHLFPV